MNQDSQFDTYWPCDICRKIRPDKFISVRKHDISVENGLPIGTMKQNVKYCNDSSDCTAGAETFRFFKPPK